MRLARLNLGIMPDFDRDGRHAGWLNRRAHPIAGDDLSAKALVVNLHKRFDYDVVDVGPLSEGWRFQDPVPRFIALHITKSGLLKRSRQLRNSRILFSSHSA